MRYNCCKTRRKSSPLDGEVVEGKSSLDTKALTGESLPRDLREGEEILSGCINLNGVIKIKVNQKNMGRINCKQNIRFG